MAHTNRVIRTSLIKKLFRKMWAGLRKLVRAEQQQLATNQLGLKTSNSGKLLPTLGVQGGSLELSPWKSTVTIGNSVSLSRLVVGGGGPQPRSLPTTDLPLPFIS